MRLAVALFEWRVSRALFYISLARRLLISAPWLVISAYLGPRCCVYGPYYLPGQATSPDNTTTAHHHHRRRLHYLLLLLRPRAFAISTCTVHTAKHINILSSNNKSRVLYLKKNDMEPNFVSCVYE